MRLKTALLLLLGVVVVAPLLAVLVVRWHMMASPAPKPDFVNFGRYVTALNLSRDPVAAKIRQQVADGPAALARERAAAQADAIDLDPTHLQKPLPPADQNAAPVYAAWLTFSRKEPLGLPSYAEPLSNRYAYTPAQLARVQQILNQHPHAMALLHQAADRPQYVSQKEWRVLLSQGLPASEAKLREGARELNTESYLLAKQGRYADAVTDQARGFRIAEHAASEPTLIAYLVGVACEAITLAGMEDILDIAGPNPQVAAQVRQAVAAHHSRLSLRQALVGEYILFGSRIDRLRTTTPAGLAASAQNMGSGGYGSPLPGPDPAARFSPEEQRFLGSAVSATGADILHGLRRMHAVADAPAIVRRRLEVQLTQEAAAAKADPVHQFSPVTTLHDLFAIDLDALAEKADQMTAEEQVLMAGAEALEVKGRTGAFPAHLAGRYSDPFADGKPLLYRCEGTTGFVVYSVGPTGKFKGGLPGQHRWNPYQVAFRYPGPAKMAVPPDMLK